MSDYIMSLPTDSDKLTPEESHIFDSIIKPENMTFHDFLFDFKETFLLGAVFFVLNLESVDDFIQGTVSYAKTSKTSLLICKVVIFMIVAFFLRNYRLLF